jgi:hypothetical protein
MALLLLLLLQPPQQSTHGACVSALLVMAGIRCGWVPPPVTRQVLGVHACNHRWQPRDVAPGRHRLWEGRAS